MIGLNLFVGDFGRGGVQRYSIWKTKINEHAHLTNVDLEIAVHVVTSRHGQVGANWVTAYGIFCVTGLSAA